MHALLLIVVLTAAVAVLALVGFFIFKKWRSRRREGKEERRRSEDENVKASQEEKLVFFEGCKEFLMEDLMRGLAEMLGRGAVGSTYRVAMEGAGEGEGVVVKRVRKERVGKNRREWMQVEGVIEEIGRWRHPNVVSLLAYHSSENELLLVFQYVPRGNLHNLLHGEFMLLD